MNQPPEKKQQLVSILYPSSCNHEIPRQEGIGEAARTRRRRRKSKKVEGSGEGGETFKKRKLADMQVNFLEMSFISEHKLDSERKEKLALELGLDPRQVAVWFQNRRARWKNKKLEEEYSNLKSVYEHAVVEKCCLEKEVIKLKEQLFKAEKEIEKLSERSHGVGGTSSPTSSLSVETDQQHSLGVWDEGFDDLLCVPELNYIHGMGWVNLSGL